MSVFDSRKVIVGVSGGMDSLYTCLLLKEWGLSVKAVMLRFSSQSEKRIKLLHDKLNKLNIELIVKDAESVFQEKVVKYFVESYRKGFTPNPCIVCNSKVKFPLLFEEADKEEALFIATGHYANIYKNNNIFFIKRGKDRDQSYFLCGLNQDMLKRLVFPLGSYKKKWIEEQVLDFGFHDFTESKDLCFIYKNYRTFLEQFFPSKKGEIIDTKGNIVGYHDGISHYTIGQRKGVKVGNAPRYVIKIDVKKNRIVVGEEKELYNSVFIIKNCNLFVKKDFFEGREVLCQVRFKTKPQKATITRKDNRWMVELEKKERAITPGQFAVFYLLNDTLLGGGWIYSIVK
jgi:tRNA-specific 2-thiouridylase